MPGGDGTGPRGQGARTGLGRGPGAGNAGQGGAFAGPGGSCVCPNCGNREQHAPGSPCSERKCSKCGTRMIRA